MGCSRETRWWWDHNEWGDEMLKMRPSSRKYICDDDERCSSARGQQRAAQRQDDALPALFVLKGQRYGHAESACVFNVCTCVYTSDSQSEQTVTYLSLILRKQSKLKAREFK